MRRIFSLCWVLVALLTVPVLATAQNDHVVTAHEKVPTAPHNVMLSVFNETAVSVQPAGTTLEARGHKQQFSLGQNIQSRRSVSRRDVAVSELSGSYVITYLSLTASGADGGRYATIYPIADTDSVVIEGFYYSDAKVRARYFEETGKLEIPSQVLGNTTQGVLDLSVVNTNGTPNRTAKITGQVNTDGTVTFDTWWAIFLNGGNFNDALVYAGYETLLERTNGTLAVNTPQGVDSYGVIISQTAANVLTVKNFGNWGLTVDFELNRDHSATIASQAVRHDKTNGDWMSYAATYEQNDGNWQLTGYGTTITTEVATDSKTIKWGSWCVLNLTARQYLGVQLDGTLTWNTGDITYPSLDVTEFVGEGTEASPYLIKTLDDLILLSDKVNNNTNYDYGNSYATYARNYLGKFFRLENDIDMGGYRFTPIGNKWASYFAGTFDGQGHTLKNLKINTGSAGYAALFGKCDTLSVIKNLNIDGADVNGTSYYAAAVAGMSLGTVQNCHVTNSTIYSTGIGVGGVASVAAYISDCSVENTTITALGGISGGVVGEVDRAISNCYASAVTINAGAIADGYPVGGVAGELYHSNVFDTPTTATDLYFAGSVNGAYNRTSNMEVGGVIGLAYRSTVTRCYNTGSVAGYDSQAHVGGVVGRLSGSLLKESYNVGRVSSHSSRMTGGIVGMVTQATNPVTGIMEESSVEEAYTAGQIDAETYRYDKQNEVRETLGTIQEGTNPTLRAIFFDKQITDFTSLQYGVLTSELTAAAGPEGFTAGNWVFAEGFYPRLKDMDDTEVAKFSASAVIMKSDNSLSKLIDDAKLNALGNTTFALLKEGNVYADGYNMSVVDDQLVVNGNFGADTLFIINGNNSRYLLLKASPIRLDGEGSESNPFLIKTKEDLILLSDISTNLQMYFPETFFKFANDIDLEYDERFNGLCADADDAHCQFEGTIDGDGYTIHRMKLGNVYWEEGEEPEDHFGDGTGTPDTNKSKGWIGFLGRLGVEGVLKNLNIAADCDLKVWATAGAFVGANYGKIINCRNYADVTAISCWIGGIAGSNENGALIDSCYNEGTVISGYMNAGGITGRSYGVIRNSMNVGMVKVEPLANFGRNYWSAGGISGSGDGTLYENVINAGTVTATGSRVGGIGASMGQTTSSSYQYHNDLINVINYGSVSCPDVTQLGALGGYASSNITTGDVKEVYWDGQVIPVKAVANNPLQGAEGVETSVLTSGQPVGNLPVDVFQFDEGLYPVLKAFADEPRVKIVRAIYPKIQSGETAYALKNDVELTAPEGTTWVLNTATDFTLDGQSKVIIPKDNTVLVVDTLVAANGVFEKPVILKRLYTLPVDGEGTLASPYLIKSTADWNALSKYMDDCAQTYEGQYLKLANDIVVTEEEPIVMLGSAANILQGDLDGDGHNISGISLTTAANYEGLISTIGVNAHVHDLTVSGSISSAFTYTGGLTGTLAGKLTNYTNLIDVASTKASAAGVAGQVAGTAVLENVVNEAEISSTSTYVAGIAANVVEGAVFHNVANKGRISQNGNSNYIAGLVGASAPASYVRCYNEGEINVVNTNNTQYAAGLIANASAGSGAPYTIDSCYNTADITAKAIVAGLVASSTSAKYIVNMSNSYNKGDIVAASTSAVSSAPTAGLAVTLTAGSTYRKNWNEGTIVSEKNLYTAGLFGYDVTNNNLPVVVDSCYNLGDITANGNQGAGLIGYTVPNTTITNCYNKGNVEGTWGLGGLVNALTGNGTTISNSWNEGNVSATQNRAGGIVAYGSPEGIYDCVNFGDISTSSTTQGTATAAGYGIGGIVGQVSGRVERCSNYGTVTGSCFTAGIVGRPSGAGKTETASRTVVRDCYNVGQVVAPADSSGYVVGISVENNGNLWGAFNVLENSFSLDADETRLDSPLTKSATVAELAAVDMGDEWAVTDVFTFPIQKGLEDNGQLLVLAAQVIADEMDEEGNITADFHVGTPKGLTWTALEDAVVFWGNEVRFVNPYVGSVSLVATAGDYSKNVNLKANVFTTGVSTSVVKSDVVSEELYTTGGQRIDAPVAGGQVVIVKKTYADGTQQTVKVVR